jgi:hypothetical protein
MRIILCARRISEDTGQKARERVDDQQGRELSAGQYIVPDGNLIGDKVLPDALVHAFISTAEQGNPLVAGQFLRHALGEDASLRR